MTPQLHDTPIGVHRQGTATQNNGQHGPNPDAISAEAKDTLGYLIFIWPTADDANAAAQSADLECEPATSSNLENAIRERSVVVVAHDTEKGDEKAKVIAAQCVKYKADKVRIWTIPRLGSEHATMKEWLKEFSLIGLLGQAHAVGWRDFVVFVSALRVESPDFSGIEPGTISVDLAPIHRLEEEMIPERLRDWVFDIARRACAPVEYSAATSVVAIGGLIGARIAIKPKRRDSWIVVPNLWGNAVGRPGVLKTPMVEEALRPLKRLAAEASERHAYAMAEWESRKLVLAAKQDAAKKNLLKEAAKKASDGRLAELAAEAMAGDDALSPKERRYIVNDLTVEKLQCVMADNPNGLVFFRDELAGLLKTMDKRGHEADRKFLLESWPGLNSHRVERMGRPDVIIPRACLSVFGTIQPGPLSRLISGSGEGDDDDGFVPRFQIMVYPDVARTFTYVDRFPSTDAKNLAYGVFKAIDAFDPIGAGCEVDEDTDVPFLRFADDAQEFFIEWYTELENRLRSGAISEMFVEHMSKYRSLMPSLALIFHMVESVDGDRIVDLGPVSLEAAELAAAWCDFLESHARRIYQAAADGDPSDAIRLAERIKQSLSNPFTIRDVQRKGWKGLAKNEDVRRAIDILEDRGWVKVVEVPSDDPRGRGRPSEQVWINPKLAEQADGDVP